MSLDQDHLQTVEAPKAPPKRGNDTAEVAVLYTSAPTVIPEAHDAYLKGRYFFSRQTDEKPAEGGREFQGVGPAGSGLRFALFRTI